MSYKDTYQQAMGKVSANDTWKQQTLEKMRAEQHRKPSLVVWKKAAFSAAALAVIVGTVLASQNQQKNSSASLGGISELTESHTYSDEQNLQNMPKVAMMEDNESLPLIQFSKEDVQEISQSNLPFEVNLSNSPQTLPIWQKVKEEWLFLGDYPLISSFDAATLVPEDNFEQVGLIYIASNGYLQPVYRFTAETADLSDLYIPAIFREYYE